MSLINTREEGLWNKKFISDKKIAEEYMKFIDILWKIRIRRIFEIIESVGKDVWLTDDIVLYANIPSYFNFRNKKDIKILKRSY